MKSLVMIFVLAQLAGVGIVRAEEPNDAPQDTAQRNEKESAPASRTKKPSPKAAAEVELEQRRAVAGQHFRRGVEFYRNRDFRAALIEFQRAFDAAPNSQVLFNVGQAAFEAKDYVTAKHAFDEYLAQEQGRLSAERKQLVARELARLADYIATIRVEVTQVGAEVFVDGTSVGTSPLAKAIVVSAGRRKLRVSLRGHSSVERVVDVAGGDAHRETITLPRLASLARTVATPSDERSYRRFGLAFWSAAGAAALLAGAAGYTGFRARRSHDDYQDRRGTFGITPEELESEKERVQRWAVSTDILMSLSVGAAVTATVIALTGDSEAQERQTITLQAGPTSLGISGSF